MKVSYILSLAALFIGLNVYSQNLEGYTKHETVSYNGGQVSLYYKATDYAIYFRVYNQSQSTVHVKVSNVESSWTDERKRVKDVYVTYVNAGSTSTSPYENNDNLSKRVGQWHFTGWKVSTSKDDL